MKKQAIELGQIGILLPLAAFIPFLGIPAYLASTIMVLISHNLFAKYYKLPAIFNQALTGALITIIGAAVGLILIIVSVLPFIFNTIQTEGIQNNMDDLLTLIFGSGVLIGAMVLILLSTILGYYFWFQSLKMLAQKTGVDYFRIAGLLYFIGALTSVILIGSLFIIAAWIIHIVAYFNIPTEKIRAEYETVPETGPQQEEKV
ncbi:MAG: DUF996 domain-containing protein [Bacteroidales bacterium]|nr:DUF996 domain-containing protein [Bacteroidales bacterium]